MTRISSKDCTNKGMFGEKVFAYDEGIKLHGGKTQSGLWIRELQGFMYLGWWCRGQQGQGGLFALAFARSCSAAKTLRN